VPHLLEADQERAAAGERVLVTTLTKRLAEDLSAYIQEAGSAASGCTAKFTTLERVEILRDLRKGEFDVLVGRQPAARRARSAGGVAGGDPRRRQGGVPAQRDVADSDDRPGRPQRERQGDSIRRQGDRPCSGRWTRPAGAARLQLAYNAEHGITPSSAIRLNEMKGAPTIRSGNAWRPEVSESDQRTKIWQPHTKGRPRRDMAK
jgi:excinuclease ABC subunit B